MRSAGLRVAAMALWIQLGWLNPAAAQQPPPQPEESDAAKAELPAAEGESLPATELTAPEEVSADDDEAIVVTGSRIQHTTFPQPLPVTVIERDAIAASGANSLADVVRQLPINSGSDLNLDIATTAGGTSQFNLRGLGLGATLVLFNGRRVVDSGALSPDGETFVDINTLPLAAIERIEILKSGGSAIYGSDAVAGVVNLISRRRMEGVEMQASYQTTSDLLQHEWDVSALLGAQGETSRATGLFSYFSRDALRADERAFTFNDQNRSAASYPSVFIPVDAAGIRVPRAAIYRDPGCGDPVLGPGTIRAGPTDALFSPEPQCLFDFNRYFMLVPSEERLNSYGRFEHDFGEHVLVFMEGSFAHTTTRRTISPSLQLNAPLYVPADHAFNPTGLRLQWQGRIRGGASAAWEQTFDTDVAHIAGGVRGDLERLAEGSKFGQWNWELAATWSGARFDTKAPDTSRSLLQQALDSCPRDAPDDPLRCWNPFSQGRPNAESLYELIESEGRTTTHTELLTVTLDLSGPLLELQGGDLSFAIGTQYRREKSEFQVDHLSAINDHAFAGALRPWNARRAIGSVYGEFAVPLLYGLELQAAGRLEHYDDVGSSGLNPMLGATWTPATTLFGAKAPPATRVRLRGTFARSFVAPSLLQTSGQQNMPAELYDAAPDPADPSRPRRSPLPNYVVVRSEGNRALEPQTARVITAGLQWSPADALELEADYFSYDFTNIVAAKAQQKVDEAFRNPNDPDITRVAGLIRAVRTRFENARRATMHGIDIGVGYGLTLGPDAGLLSANLSASYVLDYWIPREDFGLRALPGQPATIPAGADCESERCNVAGQRNRTNFVRALPRLRARLPVTWTLAPHTIAANVNFISAYRDERSVSMAGEGLAFVRIDPFVSLDLQYAIQLRPWGGASTTLKFGVNNLLGADPPYVHTGLGYDTETHEPRGRLLYARLLAQF